MRSDTAVNDSVMARLSSLREASRTPALAVCVLVFLALGAGSVEVDDAPNGVVVGTGHTVGFGELKEEWRGEVIHLSWAPRAFLLKGFLTDEECDHIIDKAKPSMEKSMVADSTSGAAIASTVRTSTGTFLLMGADDIVSRIEKRVAQVTMIPKEHQEGLQILHYQDGQKYEPHFDYFHDTENAKPERGGQRVMTVLMYLTTVDEGGETVFPNSEKKVSGPEWSECATKGLAVKAFKGDAIMFYSLHPDGSNDPSSLHGSCPTTQGNKWSATKWIHVGPILDQLPRKAEPKPGDCVDTHEQCTEWAYFGECEKNPGFMTEGCKKSCHHCPT